MVGWKQKLIVGPALASAMLILGSCGFEAASEKECYEAARAHSDAIERLDRAIDTHRGTSVQNAEALAIVAS
jgi:hypothetical protein